MNSGYRHAVFECCENAYTVVDRFHVMQKFGMALDTIRASIQNKLPDGEKKDLFNVRRLITSNREELAEEPLLKLDVELSKYPNLKKAYEAKENLRLVYQSKTKREAFEKYYAWEQTLTKDMKEVKGLQRMINRLKKEIFAYFDERYTNAYTECANSLIRRIIHDGNGYGFEVLRGKILYGTPASKQKRMKIKDMNFYEIMQSIRNPRPDEERKFIQYGEIEVVSFYTDIDELLAYIDEGKF